MEYAAFASAAVTPSKNTVTILVADHPWEVNLLALKRIAQIVAGEHSEASRLGDLIKQLDALQELEHWAQFIESKTHRPPDGICSPTAEAACPSTQALRDASYRMHLGTGLFFNHILRIAGGWGRHENCLELSPEEDAEAASWFESMKDKAPSCGSTANFMEKPAQLMHCCAEKWQNYAAEAFHADPVTKTWAEEFFSSAYRLWDAEESEKWRAVHMPNVPAE